MIAYPRAVKLGNGGMRCYYMDSIDEPVFYPDASYIGVNPVDVGKCEHRFDKRKKCWYFTVKGDNVASFDNFLIEIDDYSCLETAWDIDRSDEASICRSVNDNILKCLLNSSIKPSRVVYSGGKSYHFIFTASQPVAKEHYKEVWRKLADNIEIILSHWCSGLQFDENCSSLGRFTRFPNVSRDGSGAMQDLIFEDKACVFYPRRKVELKSVYAPRLHKPSGNRTVAWVLDTAYRRFPFPSEKGTGQFNKPYNKFVWSAVGIAKKAGAELSPRDVLNYSTARSAYGEGELLPIIQYAFQNVH